MLPPSHILSGVFFQRLFKWLYYTLIAAVLFILSVFTMHAVLDKIIAVVFSPLTFSFSNVFSLFFIVVISLYTLILLYVFGREFWLGISLALLPDIELLILKPIDMMGKELMFYKQPYIHQAFDYAMNHTYPFCFMNNLMTTDNIFIYFSIEILASLVFYFLYKIHIQNSKRKFSRN